MIKTFFNIWWNIHKLLSLLLFDDSCFLQAFDKPHMKFLTNILEEESLILSNFLDYLVLLLHAAQVHPTNVLWD